MRTSPAHARLARALGAHRRRDLLRRWCEAVGGFVIGLIGVLLALFAAEQGLDPSEALRGALGGVAAAGLGALGLAAILHVLRGPGVLESAWAVERGLDGDLQARLATALEFQDPANQKGVDPALVEACAGQAAALLEDRDAAADVSFAACRRAAISLGILLGGLVLLSGPDPVSHAHLLARFLGPALGIDIPLPVEFRVEPGSARFMAGTRFKPRVTVKGRLPGRLVAVVRRGDGVLVEYPVGKDPATREGAVDLGQVYGSFSYRFELGPYRSLAYDVVVVEPPKIREVTMRYEYPAHTQLAPRTQRGGDLDVVAPRGTRVHVELIATRPLGEVAVRVDPRGDAPAVDLPGAVAKDPHRARFTLPVERSGTWQIRLKDIEGFQEPAPGLNRLLAEEDAPPRIFLLEPGKDLERPAGAGPRLPVELHAADLFGIRELAIEWVAVLRRNFEEERRAGEVLLPLAGAPLEVTTEAELDLTGLDLRPGDRVEYRGRARDSRPGDDAAGVAYTHRYQIKVPFPRDEHAQLAQQEGEQERSLEELLEEQREWEQRLDRTLREVSADGEITWRERRELEALVEEQKAMRRKARELAAEMQNTQDQAKASGVVDQELAEKMEQVEEMLRKVADEKMHQMLDELRELMSQVKVDPGEVKEMRQRMDRDAQSKRMERMLEALKRLKALQEIEKARSEAESLAKEQEELRAETEARRAAAEGVEELEGVEEALKRRAEALAEELERLGENLEEELGDKPEDEAVRKGVEDAKDVLREGDSALEEMKAAQEALGRNDPEEASKRQGKAAQKLRQAQDALKQTSRDLQSRRRAVNLQKVVEMVRLGLAVSERQEGVVTEAFADSIDLKRSCRRLASEQDILYRGVTRFENKFEGALEDELEIKESFMTAVADLVDNLRNAKDAFEQVRPFTGRQLARTGLVKLNQVLAQLLDIQDEMQDEMSQSSMDQMQEDLQRMIERQKKMNQQTAKIPRDAQRDQAHQERMRELGEQQGQMSEEMRELAEKARKMKDMLGDMGKVAEDMEEVAEALRMMEAGEETRRKQERIVTRMLDMATSLHKQGESKKREAEQARALPPAMPPAAPPDLAEARRRFFENREREGYALEDQEAVEGYLESLADEFEALPGDDFDLDATPPDF